MWMRSSTPVFRVDLRASSLLKIHLWRRFSDFINESTSGRGRRLGPLVVFNCFASLRIWRLILLLLTS